MNIYPAIDLRQGQVVRLQQGDFARETVFGADPVAQGKQFAVDGAKWLHLVDLDGAASGKGINGEVIQQIKKETRLQIQLGGGIRDLETMEFWLDQGIDRLIIGTLALTQPDLVEEAVRQFGTEALVVGIDARDGRVATHGWNQTSNQRVLGVAQKMQSRGVSQILYTDIGRDGMLVGPDLAGLQELVQLSGMKVIASGGIGSYEDLRQVQQLGVEGVIIGQAFYTGVLTLQQVLQEVGD